MRRLIKITAAMAVALVALSAAMASSAFGLTLPEVLPHGKSWTGRSVTGTTTVLEKLNGKKVTCTGATADGNEEATTGHSLGEFHFHFSGCEGALASKCNSSGDATGVILVLGKWHLVHDTLVELGVATLFLFEALFTCSLITIHVQGSVECLVLEPTVSKTTHMIHCLQSKGDPSETKWWNDSGVEQNTKMECNESGGGFESCAELALGEVTYPEAVTIDNV